MKNLFKALACAVFLAAMPIAATTASAEDVSVPEAEVVMAADDADAAVTTITAAVTTESGTTTTTTVIETTTGTDTTTADGETTAETTTTVVSTNPDRVAIQDVVINATKQDVESGKKFKIEIKKDSLNATDELVIRYISSDESIATVDENGIVTAHKPGKVTVTVIADAVIPVVNDNSLETYTVLILDASGSMQGAPMTAQKEAAKKFCEDTIGTNKNSNHKFAVITLDSGSKTLTDFTNDIDELDSAIAKTTAYGSTNYSAALRNAAELLSKVSADAVRNIVLCSDGNPYGGEEKSTGKYTLSDYSDYEYANAAYDIAQEIKKDYEIYTLGFFHSLSGEDLDFGRTYLKDVASYDSNYAEVNKVDDLQKVFADVAGNAVSYKKVSSVTKEVEVNVTEGKTAAKAEAKAEKKADSQDSPKTGDDNHNFMLISILFIAMAAAAVTVKAGRTDK